MITFFKNGRPSNTKQLKAERTIIPESDFSTLTRNQEFEIAWKNIVSEEKNKKDFQTENQKIESIIEERNERRFQNEMLSEKYKPTHFYELVGNHQMNLDIISWLKLHKEKNLPVNPSYFFPGNKKRVYHQNLILFYLILKYF